MQEDDQTLTLGVGGGCVAGVVVGDLGDIIGDIGHTWMIGGDLRDQAESRCSTTTTCTTTPSMARPTARSANTSNKYLPPEGEGENSMRY